MTTQDGSANQEPEIDMIGEARRLYLTEPPPFIDESLSPDVQLGARREVIKAPESGNWPLPTGTKTAIVCRVWQNTGYKFWTYDVGKFRYIVKGFPATHDFKTWVVYRVWDAEDRGDPKGFGSRRVAFEYRPDIDPEAIPSGSMFLTRSSRRDALKKGEQSQADGNRALRMMAELTEEAERKIGSTSQKRDRKGGRVTALVPSGAPEASQVSDAFNVATRTKHTARNEPTIDTPVISRPIPAALAQADGETSTSLLSPRLNNRRGVRNPSEGLASLRLIASNQDMRISSKRHKELSSEPFGDASGGDPPTREQTRSRIQASLESILSQPRTGHSAVERPSSTIRTTLPQAQHLPHPQTQSHPSDQRSPQAQTSTSIIVKQEEISEVKAVVPNVASQLVPRPAPIPNHSLEEEEALAKRTRKRRKTELEILRKELEFQEAEEKLAEIRAKKAAAATSQAPRKENEIVDLTED